MIALKNRDFWFYDRYGTPVLLLLSGERFVNVRGQNLGYLKDNALIYNYRGRHCGWLENGVIRDSTGACVSFCDGANDYPMPILPIPQIPPIPAIPQIPPIPAIPQIPFLKPLKKFGWSLLSSPLQLFV